MTTRAAAAGAQQLLGRLAEAGLDDDTRQTLERLVRAAADGRPGMEILRTAHRARRDALLRMLVVDCYPGIAVNTVARRLAFALRAYAAGQWRHDRLRNEAPYQPRTEKHYLLEIMKIGDAAATLSAKTIARVIDVDTAPGSHVHAARRSQQR